MRVKGLINRKAIKSWLDNYSSLMANDRPIDAIPTNSGCKAYDGVSDRQLNKIMLEEAIEALPSDLKKCLKARWILKLPLGYTLRKLKMTKDVYYKRCKDCIEFIYYHVNGKAAVLLDLYKKYSKIP